MTPKQCGMILALPFVLLALPLFVLALGPLSVLLSVFTRARWTDWIEWDGVLVLSFLPVIAWWETFSD